MHCSNLWMNWPLWGQRKSWHMPWRATFKGLIGRGLNAPHLIIGEGALDLWSVIKGMAYPQLSGVSLSPPWSTRSGENKDKDSDSHEGDENFYGKGKGNKNESVGKKADDHKRGENLGPRPDYAMPPPVLDQGAKERRGQDFFVEGFTAVGKTPGGQEDKRSCWKDGEKGTEKTQQKGEKTTEKKENPLWGHYGLPLRQRRQKRMGAG